VSLRKFQKNISIYFYAIVILSIALFLVAAWLQHQTRCKDVQLEEASACIQYQSHILLQKKLNTPLKYGAYYYVCQHIITGHIILKLKVYVKNIDDKTGYFTVM